MNEPAQHAPQTLTALLDIPQSKVYHEQQTIKEDENMLENINIVKVHTRFPEDSGKSSNGGDYAFWAEYRPIPGDNWEVEYFTSSEFPYCDISGVFQECSNCHDCDPDTGCQRQPEVLSTAQVVEIIGDHPTTTRPGYHNPGLTILEVDASSRE